MEYLVRDMSFKTKNYSFVISLNGPLVVAGGDSGTGKSLFFFTYAKRVFGAKNDSYVFIDANNFNKGTARDLIKIKEKSLIIMDNADWFLRDDEQFVHEIWNSNNQYLLFGRLMDWFGVPSECKGEFILTTKGTIELEYYDDYLRFNRRART